MIAFVLQFSTRLRQVRSRLSCFVIPPDSGSASESPVRFRPWDPQPTFLGAIDLDYHAILYDNRDIPKPKSLQGLADLLQVPLHGLHFLFHLGVIFRLFGIFFFHGRDARSRGFEEVVV